MGQPAGATVVRACPAGLVLRWDELKQDGDAVCQGLLGSLQDSELRVAGHTAAPWNAACSPRFPLPSILECPDPSRGEDTEDPGAQQVAPAASMSQVANYSLHVALCVACH